MSVSLFLKLLCPRAYTSCLSEFFHHCGNPISVFHAFIKGAAEAGQPPISLSLWAGLPLYGTPAPFLMEAV
ncbi:hypothetical protein EDB86DRAFT_2898762 [Lactarius hatsudake]|nr:hypothetical protein EDB86DRAFT_2898762 [Lactarius hatsudake]